MKKTSIALLFLLLCGCTSINLDHSALFDLHFIQGKEPGKYIVSFRNGFSGGPIVDYKLKIKDQGKGKAYKLYVYSDLFRTMPRRPIHVDEDKACMQIELAMPDFRVGIDALLIANQSGTFPIEYRTK